MSEPGWFDDPTGRFGKRWFDGSNWTASVVSASGAVVSDAVPERDEPYPPPADPPRAAPTPPTDPPAAREAAGEPAGWSAATGYGSAAAQEPGTGNAPWVISAPPPQDVAPLGYAAAGYAAAAYPPPGPPQQAYASPGHVPYGPPRQPGAADGRYLPGPGLGVSVLGVVCVVLSLFAIDWGKGDKAGFLDLSKAVRKAGSSAVDNGGIYYYCAWAGFVLLGVTVVLVLLAGIPLPPSRAGNTYARIVGAVVAGGAAVLQTVAVAEVFKGPASSQFGAWLGVIGYLVVVVGFVLGARRARS